MRYGVMADVHGNLAALEAAIAALRKAGVDRWLCAGDLVGYGPQPNECVELLAGLEATCIAGNHDLAVVDRLSGEDRSGRLARRTQAWTRAWLRDDVRDFLAALPLSVEVDGVTVAHGALGDPQRYVRTDRDAAQQLDTLATRDGNGRLLVLGHTHVQWLYERARGTLRIGSRPIHLQEGGRYLLNPGSIGQSRQRERVPKARCIVLDLEHRQVRFLTLGYDVPRCREVLRRFDLPPECIHRPAPSRPRVALGRLARSAVGRGRS